MKKIILALLLIAAPVNAQEEEEYYYSKDEAIQAGIAAGLIWGGVFGSAAGVAAAVMYEPIPDSLAVRAGVGAATCLMVGGICGVCAFLIESDSI